MRFEVKVFTKSAEMDMAAARWLGRYLREDGGAAVLGLATGATPQGMYRALVAMYRRNEVSFARARTFNLDENVGLPPNHPQSFSWYMRRHLFDHVDAAKERVHIPDGTATDPFAEAARYEALLERYGPVDAQVLGIGANGHIGFNEPGTPFESRTHVVTLTEETRRANARFFSSSDEVPRRAITMGVANILEAGEILLLAAGFSKADALRRALEEEPTPELPASALQLHPRVTVYLDSEAASLLRL